MLDQVKSGTTARIASARSSPSTGEAPPTHRVAPPSGGGGFDNERSSGNAYPDRREGSDDNGDSRAETRRSIDSAIKELLTEARDRMPEPAPHAAQKVAAPSQTVEAPTGPENVFQRATSAYSQQTSLGGREKVLRPGVVYSAIL
jgi:hypothetical protein